VVANEASSRAALEATVKSVEDRATAAEATAASAVMERESLETRLAQAEAKIKELRAATMTANKAAERATVTVTAAEAAAQTAARAATQEKTTLKSKGGRVGARLGHRRRGPPDGQQAVFEVANSSRTPPTR
jgi:chromosome segregation ATPase